MISNETTSKAMLIHHHAQTGQVNVTSHEVLAIEGGKGFVLGAGRAFSEHDKRSLVELLLNEQPQIEFVPSNLVVRGRGCLVWYVAPQVIDVPFPEQKKLDDCDEDCIAAHRAKNQAMPFWVVVEAWDFGTLSIYFQMLRRKPQSWIAARLGLSDVKALNSWLRELNTLRNRCAHHTRIWNQSSSNPITLPTTTRYFQAISLNANAQKRLYGLISVMWCLIQHIDPTSSWIRQVADLVDSKPRMPGCTFAAMGFPNEHGFPRALFRI